MESQPSQQTENVVYISVPQRIWTKCRVKIRGACGAGIMFNAMSDATLEGLRTGVHPAIRKDTPPDTIAKTRLYKDEAGNIGIPADNMWACIVDGGRFAKNGKKQISTRTDTTLPAWLMMDCDFIVLRDLEGNPIPDILIPKGSPGKGWMVDIRKGNLPKDGTAVCLVRPKVREWMMEFEFFIDEDEVDATAVAKLFVAAGKYVGLCEHRATSPFGRYDVDSFCVINPRKAVAAWKEPKKGKSKKAGMVGEEATAVPEAA